MVKVELFISIPFKMFQQIELEKLQINETYKILANNYVFKGRFKGFRYWNEIRPVLDRHTEFSLEFDITRDFHFKRTNFTMTRPFYKFVSTNGATLCEFILTRLDRR
jgi:hypothetical protein